MERRHFIGGMSAALVAAAAAAPARAQSTSGNYINVRDYGAKGDGATDDSGAFNSALQALKAVGGGTLFVPAGDYLLRQTASASMSSVRIQGVGYKSRIVNGQASAPAIQIGDSQGNYYDCGVLDLAFGQASSVSAGSGNCGLLMVNVNQSFIERCTCKNFPGALYEGYVFNACSALFYSGVEAANCLANGFRWTNNCVDMYAVNCLSNANGYYGFLIQDSQGFYFNNMAAWGNYVAWGILSIGGPGNKNLWFTDCIGDTSAQVNWNITNCHMAFFNNCWGSTQKDTTQNAWAEGFFLSGSDVVDVTFTGGAAVLNNGHGVFVDGGAARISFIGFRFGGSPGTVAPVGNGIASGGGNGLFLGTTSDIIVNSCYFCSNSGYGLYQSPQAHNVNVACCIYLSNTKGNSFPS